MNQPGIEIHNTPELKYPILIAGFDGWGNALSTATGMVEYLIRLFDARPFARINPDRYYRYDVSRPVVEIEAGRLESITPPGGELFAASPGEGENDLVFLSVEEPHLRWYEFVDEILSLGKMMGVHTVVTLGGMYDNVLHTDRVISGLASDAKHRRQLEDREVVPISYSGPSAIHSLFHQAAVDKGINSVSLWCHCPVYIQNVTHYGNLIQLAPILEHLCHIPIATRGLEEGWQKLSAQIQEIVESNSELQNRINEIRKTKARGLWAGIRDTTEIQGKVIDLKDFFQSR